MSLCLQCEHPDMYGILTKREVKVVGYWPSHIFADRDEVEVHKHAKKERNCKLTLKCGTKIKE